jgi:hypothetical protein
MPVDADTWLKVSAVLDRSQRAGWDPAEELDRNGLLLTSAQRTQIQVSVLTTLLNQISIYRPVELLRRKFHGGHQSSPADMYVVMLDFIEEFREAVKEGT